MAKDMRTFVGLRVGEVIRRRMHREAERLQAIQPGLRPVPLEDLHMTLQFLGWTSDEDVYRVSQALARAAAPLPPIDVTYVGLGAFPAADRARVVWAGLSEVEGTEGRLTALVEAIGTALGELGYPAERRRFHPHITLARMRKRPEPPFVAEVEAGARTDFGAELLSEVKLIVSDPGQHPYHYIDLTTVDLEGDERA